MVLESSTTVWFIRMLLEKNLERPLLLSSALMPVGCMTTTALYLLQCLLMVNPRSFLLHSVSFQLRIKKTGRRFFLLFLHAGYDNDVEHPGEPFLEGGPWPLSIISDRQKGLLPAIEELSIVDWTIKHYYCTQHLASNVKEKFGTAIEKLFRRACQVSTRQEFNKILQDIRQIKQSAFDYISAIPAENYALHTQTSEYPRFGNSCSNTS